MEIPVKCTLDDFYRELIHELPDIIYKINSKGEFIYINNSITKLGYKPDELIGKHFSTLFHDEDLPQIQHDPAIQKIRQSPQSGNDTAPPKLFDERRTGKRITKNLRIKLAPGKEGGSTTEFSHGEIFASGVYYQKHAEQKDYIGTVGIIRDITELNNIKETLSLTEKHYRLLIENTSDIISILATDGTILFKSNSVEKNLGYRQRDLVGENEIDLIHPGDKELFTLALATHHQTVAHQKPFEMRYLHSNGAVCYFENRLATITDSNGSIMWHIWYSRDITERIIKEKALREQEEKYRALFEGSSDAIVIISPEKKIADCNIAALMMFKTNKKEIINKTLSKIFTAETLSVFESCMNISNGAKKIIETMCATTGNHQFPCLIMSRQVQISGQKHKMLTIRDTTMQKKAQEDLLKAQKIESLGILAGGIAHDFNNLLTPVSGNISLAKKSLRVDSKNHKLLGEAEKAVDRARQLTQQLLSFSKGESPVQKNTSIQNVLLDTTSFVLRGSKVRCTCEINRDLWLAKIDEGSISQIIHNLTINAMQAMPSGGNFLVEASNYRTDDTTLLPLEPGDYIKIKLSDEGCGISKNDLNKIFDPYYSSKNDGHGLGLTVVYSILQRHKGHITVQSEENSGTTFEIYLPASTAPLPDEKEAPQEPLHVNGKILFMEDDRHIQKVTGEMLTSFGCDVHIAENGDDAIRLFKAAGKKRVPFDMIILDLTIPGGMGGQDVLKEIRKINDSITAIVTSGYTNDEVITNYKNYGFSGVLVKPYDMKDLSLLIKKHLITGN